jgi:hypothetical protein
MAAQNPFSFDEDDDFNSFTPSSSPEDRGEHKGRKVRARVADFVGGGSAYSGDKPAKEPKPAKAPLRDRIAGKIASKPKDSGEAAKPPHDHDFDCANNPFCDK